MSRYAQQHREFLEHQFCKAPVLKASGQSDAPAWSCPLRSDQEQNERKRLRNRVVTKLHRENPATRREECRIPLRQRDGSRRTFCLAFESPRLAPAAFSHRARAPESGCGCDRRCQDTAGPAPAPLRPSLQESCVRRSPACGSETCPANFPFRSILAKNVSQQLRTRPSFPVVPAG